MTNYRRRLWRLVLIVLALFASIYAWRYYRIHFPDRNHPMISLLQDMQTYCVGRYQIDLPRGTRLIRAEDSAGRGAGTTFYVKHPIGDFQANSLMQRRWNELKELKPEPGMKLSRLSERIDLPDGGTVFTFNHEDVYADEWPGGEKGTVSFYETEGYLWRDETLYEFKGNREREETIAAMKKLVPMDNRTLPAQQGFCAGRSFFPGPPVIGESVNLAFRLPEEANTEIRIKIPSGNPIRPDYILLNLGSLETTQLRSAKRDIGALDGEEWGDMSTDSESSSIGPGVAAISYAWYHPGKGYDHLQPGVHIFMEGFVPANGQPPETQQLPNAGGTQARLSKEQFTALWDGIIKTFRPRPGAF